MSQNDNIDTCTVCGKEIPPGPDFCGHACETKFVLVQDLARELYDRFVMGGWEPVDSYAWISKRLREAELSGDSPRPQESKVSIARAAQLFRKLDVCSSLSAKLILLRNFCERYAAELREAKAPHQPSHPVADSPNLRMLLSDKFKLLDEEYGPAWREVVATLLREAEHSELAKESHD